MYTVTLTFADAQMAADAISDLLNNHRQATISLVLDEMISPDHPEYVPTAADRAFSTESPDGPRNLRDENLTARERKLRDRMRENGADAASIMDEILHKRYVDEARKTPEYKAYVDRQRRKSVLRLRHLQRIIDTVSCPKCGAERGKPCVSRTGKPNSHYVHEGRRQQADAR